MVLLIELVHEGGYLFVSFAVIKTYLHSLHHTFQWTVGRHQSNLLRTKKFDLSSKNIPFLNTDNLYSLRKSVSD